MTTGDLRLSTGVVRAGVGAWLALVAMTSTFGGIRFYRDPSQLGIPGWVDLYRSLGLSDRTVVTAVQVLPLVFAWSVACFIAWSVGEDRGALSLAAGMVSIYFLIAGLGYVVDDTWFGDLTADIAVVAFVTMLLTVPTGRFTSRWFVMLPASLVATFVAEPGAMNALRAVLEGAPARPFLTQNWPFVAAAGVSLVVGVVALALAGSHQRLAEVERNQTRWLSFGLLWMNLPAFVLVVAVVSDNADAGVLATTVLVAAIGSYVMPVTVLVAVFRYHLFEIDRIVSRTVTYAAVAVVVGLVYAVPVLLLPSALGESNELIVAGSTLLAAAVFNPVRRRIQRRAERRFNRSNYDAEHEVDVLSARLRSGTGLDFVAQSVEDAVQRTVQPSTASVWIRDPA